MTKSIHAAGAYSGPCVGRFVFSILSRMRLMVDYHSKPAPGLFYLFIFLPTLSIYTALDASLIDDCVRGDTLILLKTLK